MRTARQYRLLPILAATTGLAIICPQAGIGQESRGVVLEALDAYIEIQSGEFGEALQRLRPLTESDAFASANPMLQREVYLLLQRAIRRRSGELATRDLMIQISEMPVSQPGDWIDRLDLSDRLEDTEDATYSLIRILDRWPEQLNSLSAPFVGRLARESLSELEDPDVFNAIVDAVLAADWDRPYDYYAIHREWYRLALLLVERGDLERAAAVTRRIWYPPTLIGLRADRRFDPLRDHAPDTFDFQAVVERELAVRRRHVAENPTLIAFPTALSAALRRADLADDALVVVNTAVQPQPNAGITTATGWDDESNMYLFLNERADVLWQLGAAQNALAQLQEARVAQTYTNVPRRTQSLNLARYYARSGQADRARTMLEEIDETSRFGRMQLTLVRVMAAVADGNERELDDALDFMERNASENRPDYQRALVYAGQLDDAAEILIERLGDEKTRTRALVEIQSYLDDLATEFATSLDRLYAERKTALLARDDVRAAIEAVGHVESYPTWFVDFEA